MKINKLEIIFSTEETEKMKLGYGFNYRHAKPK